MTENETSDEAERALARAASWALPAAAVMGAIVVKVFAGVGPAILVLAAGALVGVIALLWASLRTLGGDAPLAEGLAEAAVMREKVSDAGERKRRVLRALKDIEHEHSVGKISDDDYEQLAARYRETGKEILREMDVEIEPLRAKAEALARNHLAKRALAPADKGDKSERAEKSDPRGARAKSEPAPRLDCPKCATENEPDATFCKKCGAGLVRVSCSKCTTSNEPDAAFCKKCGTSLARPEGAVGDATA